MEEWRGAAVDYLSLMNNSELTRIVRANAARRWAVCMGNLGEGAAALARLSVFAGIDAEAALVAGRLAEEAGLIREAFDRYLFATAADSPSIPPATPGRIQEATYHAALLALREPALANPLLPPDRLVADMRSMLEKNALADLNGERAIPMLNLLGDSLLGEYRGWETTYRLAHTVIERADSSPAVDRAMYILAARARFAEGRFDLALDELDMARELAGEGAASRADAATITLETARAYRAQERWDDALRAYADVFAMYPDQEEADDAARLEAAVMLLTRSGAGDREREQARGILAGLRDQMHAERIMRGHGIR
jgi:tetratricopeptide (TPR) repeat protein